MPKMVQPAQALPDSQGRDMATVTDSTAPEATEVVAVGKPSTPALDSRSLALHLSTPEADLKAALKLTPVAKQVTLVASGPLAGQMRPVLLTSY